MILNKYILKEVKLILGLLICLIFLPISGFAMLELETAQPELQATTACDFEAKLLIERSPKCGNLGGVVSVWVTGNQAPVTYFWKADGGEMFSTGTVNTLEKVPANITHWAIIRDASGCEIMLDFELADQPCYCPLTARAVINKYPECGEPNGSVRIDYSGDQGEVTFSWGSSAQRNDLEAGRDSVTVTDEAGCKVVVYYELTEFTCCENYGATAVINKLPDCGESNGSVSINVIGETGALSYSWGEGNRMDNLAAGEYWIVVKDATGCVVTVYFKIEGENCCANSDLTAMADINQQPECGQDNGSVSIIAAGGVGPYKYSWGVLSSYENLRPGIYNVTVTDAFGCTAEVNFELVEPENCCTDPNFKAEAIIHQQPECGKTNGSVTINATGGVAPYKYSWGVLSSYENLNPGNYIITVTDALGCPFVLNFTLIQEDCCKDTDLAVAAIVNRHPECGKSNGAVRLEVTGGQTPYAYSWGGKSSYDNLNPGNYTVTITDAFDCSIVVDFDLIEGPCCPNFAVELAIKDPTNCDQNDGAVDFIIMGEVGNLTYTWDDGLVSKDSFRTNLSNRTYQVTITDDTSKCLQILRLPLKTFAPCECNLTIGVEVTKESCAENDGKICLNITGNNGPISYLWEDGTTTACLEGKAAGTYKVTVKDEVCEKDTVITIIKDCPCTLGIGTEITDESCAGSDGKICLNVTGNNGPINYLWEDGTTTACLEGKAAGTYKVTVKDEVCEKDTVITILKDCIPPECELKIVAEVTKESCEGSDGKICLNVTGNNGPISYLWEDGTITACLEGKAAGTYKVTVKDEVCEKDTVITIIKDCPECELKIVAEVTKESCAGSDGKICLNVTGNNGPINYLWEDGTTTACLEGKAAGTYKVTVKDEVCEKDTVITIIKDCPECDLTIGAEVNPPSCNESDGKICLVAISSSDTISYLWEDSTKAICREDLAAGTYTVTVSDGVCEKDTMIILSDSMSILEITPDTLCSDTSIGGLNYELTGCFVLPIDIQILNGTVVRTINKDTVGSGRIESLLPNKTYTFIVTDANGQEIHSQEFSINIPKKPDFELYRDTVLCEETLLTEIGIELNGAATFFWSTTPNFKDTLSKEAILEVPIGNYYIALDAGCITMDSVIVKDGRIMVEFLNPDPLCMPGMTNLNVLNLRPMQTLSYDWSSKELITSPTDTTDSPEVNISQTTQFNVAINNQFGCELRDSITVMVFDTTLLAKIRVLPKPEKIAATTSSELCLSTMPLPDGFTFEWQPAPTLTDMGVTATVTPVENGTRYFATIFSEPASQCIVTRDTAIWIGCDDDALFVPNAFSPNGDGINDVLYVRGADGLESMTLMIYNRWGEKVFETSDPSFGWDGYFKGKPVGPDVYGYYLTITCPIGGRELKGNITVLK